MAKSKTVISGSYDGKDIVGEKIDIRNAGGGLGKSLAIEPRDLHIGDEIDVLIRCTVTGHTHKAVPDSEDQLERTLVLTASVATPVDTSISEKMILEQQRKLDEAAGKLAIPFSDDQTGEQ